MSVNMQPIENLYLFKCNKDKNNGEMSNLKLQINRKIKWIRQKCVPNFKGKIPLRAHLLKLLLSCRKFGLHAVNMKFNTQNYEWINLLTITCVVLPVY